MTANVRHILLLLLVTLILNGCASMGQAMKASPSLANLGGIVTISDRWLEERYVNDESQFMRVNGYRIHYRDIGQGEPIILMHGIFSSLQTWDSWVRELSRTHRVIALDMPGYGMTGAPENPDNFDEDNIVNTVAKFVERLDLDGITLVGNSLGGFVASQYAAQYRDRVDRLALIDPFGYPQQTPFLLDLGTWFPIQFMGQWVQPPFFVTFALSTAYGDADRISDRDAYRYVHMSQREGAKPIYMETLKMVEARAENNDPLPFYRIKAPTLLMWGEDDEWVPISLAERWLADITRSALVTYPGVGHIPMEESPEATLEDFRRFLRSGLSPFSESVAGTRDKAGEEGS
ncbi:alpha/beta hydrolase [Tamilnaduibacter salinus]|uniref:Alpha/beta hydrolase n=1 Tax=Tamilnaduibacter salinus TaxID=1484056 RepID=A0A2A2HZ34_9GAMM|nr:alpha/beta hydrolase [Tamilnaduibacter salinus]PAV24901.1 alpha/beta hydrolase [Tamilnaduibacter salinus]